MVSINKYYLTYIFLFVQILINAQNLKTADSLFDKQLFFEALIEYERNIYLNDDKDIQTVSLLKKSYCYKHLKQYSKAIKTLDRINIQSQSIETKNNIHYEYGLNHYFLKEYNLTINHLNFIKLNIDKENYLKDYSFLEILALNRQNKWLDARILVPEFLKFANYPDSIKENILEYYSKTNIPKLKSIEKAEKLSVFIPGSGQFYAGNKLEGLTNFVFHLGVFGYGINEAINSFYLTAYFSGVALTFKLYSGGPGRAKDIAENYNKKIAQKYNENIQSLILGNF